MGEMRNSYKVFLGKPRREETICETATAQHRGT